mmetsp:Transcript_10819/g.27848  ORF Transcript_10819/g.27848 Transcript_10819/m.27848 type:complete len:228 (+) Transcript_10819:296-979(+)
MRTSCGHGLALPSAATSFLCSALPAATLYVALDPSGITRQFVASTMAKIPTSLSCGRLLRNFCHPLKKAIAVMTATSATTPPASTMRLAAAMVVPPVAMRSSKITTRSPGLTAEHGIERVSSEYSVLYGTSIVGPGSFPAFRIMKKGTPRRRATGGPKMKPRASRPQTDVTSLSLYRSTKMSIARLKALGSAVSPPISKNMGMPLKSYPGMVEAMYFASASSLSTRK